MEQLLSFVIFIFIFLLAYSFDHKMSEADLFAACKSGDLSRVKDLLALGTLNINWQNTAEKDKTPLHTACMGNQLAIVEELLKSSKLDPNIKDANKAAPADMSFNANKRAILKCLLQDPRVAVSDLFRACALNQPDKVKELLSNPELNVNETAGKGRTALHAACSTQSLEALQVLLLDQRVEVNNSSDQIPTALYIACSEGFTDVVQCLLKDPRVDVNKTEEMGESPLYTASSNGFIDIVRLLGEDHRTEIELAAVDGVTPLEIAFVRSNNEIVQYIKKARKY